MSEVLLYDPELKRLSPQLTEQQYEALEADLMKNGCTSPIVTWGNFIVDGFQRYAICSKCKIPFKTEKKDFASRDEAIIWIINHQLPKASPKTDFYRYLVGKKYITEKKQYSRSGRKKAETDLITPSTPSNRWGRAGSLADQLGISHFAIHSYKEIAEAVDRIASKDSRLTERYLSGSLRIKQSDLNTIAELPEGYLHSLMNNIIREKKTYCKGSDILDSLSSKDRLLENKTARERRMAKALPPQPSVKDMPEFDPDREVIGMSLTISAWHNSLERLFSNTKMNTISKKARDQLQQSLINLQDSIELILLAIEEESENG